MPSAEAVFISLKWKMMTSDLAIQPSRSGKVEPVPSVLDHDKEILKPLAERLRAAADRPELMGRTRRLTRHNHLESEGPLVFVFPEGAWSEILPQGSLLCHDPFCRSLEEQIRQKLFLAEEIRDDSVPSGVLEIAKAIETGSYGVDVEFRHGENRGSYIWQPPFKEISEAPDRLQQRVPLHDESETLRRLETAFEAVGDLMPLRLVGSPYWTLGMTWKVIDFIGMEPLMIAMIEEPDEVHRLMAWMRDEHMAWLDHLVNLGVLTGNSGNDYCGSGGYGFSEELYPPSDGPVPLDERWGFAESQETVGISPEMFAEFILPYQIPLLDRFGLNHYGCCEPLDKRWEHVKKIPRLRRVSVSPWADEAFMAEALRGQFVYSRKPNPAPLCVGFDERALAQSLDETLTKARGCVVEIVMKDTHTVQGEPDRFRRWVDLARSRIDKVWK